MSLIPNRTNLAAMRFRWRLASRPSANGESAGTWGLLPTQRADFGRCARALLSELPDGGYVALERLDVYADGYSIAEVIAFAGSLDAMRAHGVTPDIKSSWRTTTARTTSTRSARAPISRRPRQDAAARSAGTYREVPDERPDETQGDHLGHL